MKIVIDTNIIVSAIFWGGIPRSVLEIAQKKHTLCFSNSTLDELRTILNYSKFAPYISQLSFSTNEFIERLTEHALISSANWKKKDIIKEDPADDKFLICALVCQAGCIISGDKHLLKLKKFNNIPIIRPKQFIEIYGY